jgi:hypothetical protein
MAPPTAMRAGSIDRVPTYIANPDLVEPLANGAPLVEVDWQTRRFRARWGYIDHPTIRHAAAQFAQSQGD